MTDDAQSVKQTPFKSVRFSVSAVITATIAYYLPLSLSDIKAIDLKFFSEMVNSMMRDPSTMLMSAGALIGGGLAIYQVITGRIITKQSNGLFFSVITQGKASPKILEIPIDRFGYSDRIAYAMAELSELAYHPVAGQCWVKPSTIELVMNSKTPEERQKLLADIEIACRPLSYGTYATDDESLRQKLGEHFRYIDGTYFAYELMNETEKDRVKKYDVKFKRSAQGFACAYINDNPQKSYIVVVFRGSETNVEDWLTNIDAEPHIDHENIGRIHNGFYSSYMVLSERMQNTIQLLQELTDDSGKKLLSETCPIIFTGHSLGGALATIAAREYERKLNTEGKNRKMVVYTFGAPRIGDSRYFLHMKTPVYRVVNSSDMVPRVPLGFYNNLLLLLFKGIRHLISFVSIKYAQEGRNDHYKSIASGLYSAFEWLENKFEKISYYRHTGDLRYLTDIPSGGDVEDVELLPSPCRFDRIQWLFRSLMVSFGSPVKNHSMQIYRNKLEALMVKRNRPTGESAPEQ